MIKRIFSYLVKSAPKKHSSESIQRISAPKEIAVEIESRCNLNCSFCFNKLSFAKKERGINLSTKDIKEIIKRMEPAGIKIIKFTGGEPLLRPDILEILSFAKNQSFDQVRLNTNGTLIHEGLAKEIVKYVDDFLIPLEGIDPDEEEEITGLQNVYTKKINAIKVLKKAGAKKIRIGTVISKNLIDNLEKIESFVETLQVDAWGFFRPILSNGEGDGLLNKGDYERLTDKLTKILERNQAKIYRISNALPFCAFADPQKFEKISFGAIFDDGHTRFVVDPRGFAKPHYFIDENIGNPKRPMECWQHPFMVKMRSLEFLPEGCENCGYKKICRGGSRFAAKVATNSYKGIDPMVEKVVPINFN